MSYSAETEVSVGGRSTLLVTDWADQLSTGLLPWSRSSSG